MNVPKLLRIALFSVFALLLTGGIMAAQAQVDDPVTVDNDGNEDFLTIQNGLSELDTDAGNQGETSGVLEVEAGDYSGDGNLDLSVVSNLETVELRVIQDNEGTGTVDRVITQDVTVDGGLTLNVTSDDGARFLEVQNTGDDVGTGLGGNADIFLGSGAVNIQSSGGIQLADGGEIELTAGFGGSNSLDAPGSLNLTYDASGGNISAGNEIPSNRDLGSSGDLIINDGTNGNEVTFGGNLTSASFALTGSAAFDGDFTTVGAFTVASGELLDVSGTLTVTGATTSDVTVNASGMNAGLEAGSIDITGDDNGTGLLDVNGSVTVSDAATDALKLESGSGQVLNVNGGTVTVQNGGTDFNGAGNTVRVTGSADVDLGDDVTFAQADPQFNLNGLSVGTDQGVTVGTLTAPFTPATSNNGSTNPSLFAASSGGSFTATSGVTLNVVDPATGTDDLASGEEATADVSVQVDATNGDFDLGTVSLGTADDEDGSGSPDGTFAAEVSLTVDDAAGTLEEGRITAAGSEFNDVETAAGGDGTITFAGNSETKIVGSLTNNGLVNVDSDVRFDASSVKDAGNLPADNNGGEISVAQNTLFIVDAAGTDDGDIVLDNNNTSSAGGVTGNGTLRFLSADGNTHVVNADDDGHAFPATVQHQAGANGSGTLEIQVSSTGNSTDENVIISFGGGSGDLTADQAVDFDVDNSTGGDTDEISEIEAGTVTANNDLDIGNATFTSNPSITLNKLDVTSGTTDLPGSAALTATNSGNGEVRVSDGTLNAGVASITADDIVATGGTLDATAPSVLSSASTINNSVTSSGGSIDLSGATASIDIVEGTAVSGGGSIDLSGLSAVVTTRDLTISNGNGGGTVNVEGSTLDITRDFSRAGASSSVLTTDNSSTIRFVNPSSGGAQEGQFDPGAQFTVNGEIVVDKVNTKLTLLSPIRINGDLTINETGNQFADDPELDLRDNIIFGNDSASNPQGGTFTINGTLTTQTGNKVIFRAPGTGDYNIVGSSQFRNVQNVSGKDILIGQGTTSNLTFTGTLDLETGGVSIQNGSDLSPASSGSPVVRRDVTSSSTQITTASSSESFNDLENAYGLTYDGSGSGDAADELTDQVGTLTVASPTTVTVNETNVDDLTGANDDVTVSTITIDGELNSANRSPGPGETITVTGTSHSVSGSMLARLDIDTDGATVTGSTGDDANSELGEVRVLSGSDNAEITDIKKVGGDVTVGLTTESDADLDVSLVEDTDGPTSPSQTITGSVTLDGSDFGIGSPVTVQGDIAANSGSVSLGDNNLTVADANFTGASGVSYSAGSGFLVMEDDEGSASTNTITTAGETVVNLRSTTNGDGGGQVDDTELNGSVDVSGTLDIENTIDTDASSETLTFSNSGSDQAILDNATAFSGSGSFEAQGTEIVMTQATSISNFVIDASGSTVTLSDDPNATSPSGPFILTVGSSFTMEAGIFDHTDNTVDLTASDGFTVASGFSPSTSASDIQSDADTFFGISGGGSTTLNSDVSFDRLDVNSNDLSLSDDGHNLTVNEELILSQQFDGRSGDDDDDIVIADGATIERPNGNEGDPLTEPPTFLGDVTLEYTDGSNNTTSDDEVPSSSSSARVDNLIVDVQGQTFSLEETGAVTGNVVVTESVDLQEGTIEHNKTSGNSQGSNTGRRIELDGSDVTFFQRDGSIASNGANTGNLLATSNYTLVYRPDDNSVTTTTRELRSGSVSSLEFVDSPVNASGKNLTSGFDATVGGVTVNRTASGSEFNLSSSTLTVNGLTIVKDGDIIDRGDDGNAASISTDGLAVEDGLIDGTDTGSTNSGDGIDLTATGTVSITGGEIDAASLDADGKVDATGGTLDDIGLTASSDVGLTESVTLDNGNSALNVTFDGSGDQNFKIEGDDTIQDLGIEQGGSQNGSTVTVSDVSNSGTTLSIAGDLTLENGILVSNEQGVAQGENPVEFDLTGGTIDRDVADGDASHIAGPVTQTIGTGTGAEALYPVGTADGTYRQFRLFFPNGLSSNTDVTVEHENQDPEGTSGFPLASNFSDGSQGTFNLSQDYPSYYWRVETGSPTSLQQDYEVSARADGFEFGPGGADEDDETQFRIIRRTDTDPQQVDSDWSLVGSGTNYDNLLQGSTSLDTRTTAATQSLNTQGSRFTVTSPQKPKPVIATNDELPIAIGSEVAIDQSSLETTDSDNTPSELTYTVTSAPSQGELLLSGSAVGQGGTFTQQDINDGNVKYNHTADPVDDDNFEFEVSDNADQTTSGTFSIDVQAAPTIATNSGLSLTQGNQVPVQTGDLEVTDEDNAASELTYEITTAPAQGELLLSGSAVGEGGTFTQQDINDGNVEYNHTADPVDDDNFEFEVSDTDGRSVTGTVNVTVNAAEFAISGTVVHPRTDGDSDPVEGATVTINDSDGNVVATPETGTDGSYSTDVAEGDYTLEVTAVDGIPETPSDDGLASGLSVNSTDAFVAQDNFLGSATLSPIQTTVGDVTGSEDVVNTTDAFDIQGYFLDAIENELDVGVLSGGTESVTVSGGDETGIQLEAVAFGDINLSGDLNGAADGSGTQVASALSASTAGEESVSLVGPESDTRTTAVTSSVSAEDTETTFEVPVRLDRSAELGAFDLTMSYDSEKATLQGVSAPNAEVSSSSEDGTVRLAWFDKKGGQNPLTVSDGGKLVTLTFKADANVKKGETFELEDIEGQLTGPDAESLSGVGVTVPQVSFGIERPDEFALEGNAPNPFQSRTTLSVQMPESGSATVSVYNTLGQQVKEIQTNLAAGDDQRIEVDGSGLSSGVYMYRIEVEMESKTIRRSGRMTLVK